MRRSAPARVTARSSLPALLIAVLVVTIAAPALGDQLGYGTVLSGFRKFVPPNADGTALSDLSPQGWSGFSFWVDERGEYGIASQIGEETPYQGRALVYRGILDPDRPLDGLVAVYDHGPSAVPVISIELEAGVIYYLVHTFAEEEHVGIADVGGFIHGPGNVRRSYCLPPGDDSETEDLGEALAFETRSFHPICAFVEVTHPGGQIPGPQGNFDLATVAPYRSADSGLFWFFDPDNWELLVKVLDGCAVNGHYWVFVAATTDVEWDLFVNWKDGDLIDSRRYHNDAGHPSQAITDTTAIRCDSRPQAAAFEAAAR